MITQPFTDQGPRAALLLQLDESVDRCVVLQCYCDAVTRVAVNLRRFPVLVELFAVVNQARADRERSACVGNRILRCS